MKPERSGISLLLGLLLLLSSCIGLLYAQPQSRAVVRPNALSQEKKPYGIPLPVAIQDGTPPLPLKSEGGLAATQFEKAMNQLVPLVESESVEKIVEVMRGTPSNISLKIIKTLSNNRLLSRDNVVQVICGIALQYANNKEEQYSLFNLILEDPLLMQGGPLLYVAAKSKFSSVIPVLLSWIKDRAADTSALTHEQENSLKYAVIHDKLNVLQILAKRGG